MKNMIWMAALVSVAFLSNTGCDKDSTTDLKCNEFTLNQTFKAKIDESWCLTGTDLKITFGPFIEDSRCNVPEIDCVWAGRYVMGATIDNGQAVTDTFFAVNNWTDTLYHQDYQVILAKVYPEERASMEPLDPSSYSFDISISKK